MSNAIDKRLAEYQREPAPIDRGQAGDREVLDAWANMAKANSRMWDQTAQHHRQTGWQNGSGSNSDPPDLPSTTERQGEIPGRPGKRLAENYHSNPAHNHVTSRPDYMPNVRRT